MGIDALYTVPFLRRDRDLVTRLAAGRLVRRSTYLDRFLPLPAIQRCGAAKRNFG